MPIAKNWRLQKKRFQSSRGSIVLDFLLNESWDDFQEIVGGGQISIGKGKFRSISQDEIISIRYRSKIALYLCKCVKF